MEWKDEFKVNDEVICLDKESNHYNKKGVIIRVSSIQIMGFAVDFRDGNSKWLENHNLKLTTKTK